MDVQSAPQVKLQTPAQPVQELLKNVGDHVPERYIHLPHKQFDSEICDKPTEPRMDCQVIDLSLLSASSSSLEVEQELQKLRSALSSWGCFQLINHGIAASLLDQLRKVGKEFFALPLEVKQKSSTKGGWFEGYGNDAVSENQPFNWNDKLHLIVYPTDKRKLEYWPEDLPNFRETLEEYSTGMRDILEIVLTAMARSLDLEESSFFNQFEGGTISARFNYYPPCPTPERVLGLKPHSDGTLITILLQDEEVEGLQALKDDQWYTVPLFPEALFINVGDQVEILSNGIFKSQVHRVVIDKERERISVAVPSAPHPEKEIGPLGELIDKNRPHQYKIVKSYISTFPQYFARGERAIDAAKIHN